MKQIVTVLIFLTVVTMACQSNKIKTGSAIPKTDTSKFYPTGDFFKEQVKYVDLRNFTIYKITVKNGKRDSSVLTKDQFIEWTKKFLDWDISSPKFAGMYRESVFHDLSTASLTFNYTPIDREASIQNVEVLLDEDTHFVKRVYIKSVYNKGDTSVTEQCSWKANKSFHHNRLLTTKSGYVSSELNYINWNDKP